MGFIKKQIKMEIAALSVDIQVSVCIYTHDEAENSVILDHLK